jgi:hypothetical protein
VRLAGEGLAVGAAAFVFAARGGSWGNRLGRDAAAVSEPAGLRVRLGDGSVASAFATVEVRFLGGMARDEFNR